MGWPRVLGHNMRGAVVVELPLWLHRAVLDYFSMFASRSYEDYIGTTTWSSAVTNVQGTWEEAVSRRCTRSQKMVVQYPVQDLMTVALIHA